VVAPEKGPLRLILGVQVFNPSHGLDIGNFSKIPLSGGKVGMLLQAMRVQFNVAVHAGI
jgi:hypothetical protein